MAGPLSYLGIEFDRPRVGVFDFTSCEGCQLQLVNNEATLLDFLNLVELVNFREAMSEKSDDYDVALVEGSISRADEVERLEKIRANAKILVALGSCACFGGVNQLKNRFHDLAWVKKEVYGDFPIATREVRPLSDFVSVDFMIYGCPPRKEEIEKVVANLVLGKKVTVPKHPVCMECKANENICLYALGEPCLGPVTRAGCDAWCPTNRRGCWGCRGPAEVANVRQLEEIMARYGFSRETLIDRLECFGGFHSQVAELRTKTERRAEAAGAQRRRKRS
ncbi:MAG: NADH:ubiquinone oxidoreductase [Thermodesulfobacteriota bacterium]